MQDVLRRYDILLVADEIICGFGRTGRMFGCETYAIEPDILVLSKALSSFYMPISALLANDRVLEPVIAESDRIGTFGHGFTGGGHPRRGGRRARIHRRRRGARTRAARRQNGRVTARRSSRPRRPPPRREVRGVGLIAAAELVAGEAHAALGTPGQLGGLVNAELQAAGVISRNMGDAIAFCPPLVISEDEVDDLLARFRQALDRSADQLSRTA